MIYCEQVHTGTFISQEHCGPLMMHQGPFDFATLSASVPIELHWSHRDTKSKVALVDTASELTGLHFHQLSLQVVLSEISSFYAT